MVSVQKTNISDSLIELLVVIGIIALLAAIIFPVFASVKENGRQNTAISNMHDISTKLEMYKLDTHQYPPVLFGYMPTTISGSTVTPVTPTVTMDKLLDYCQANNAPTNRNNCSNLLPGLYPEYINSYTEFTDPNNTGIRNSVPAANAQQSPQAVSGPITYTCSGTGDPEINCQVSGGTFQPQGTLVVKAEPVYFYEADAFDVNPRVDNKTTTDSTVYVPRYQTAYTSILANLDCGNAPTGDGGAVLETFCGNTQVPKNDYLNQMRWRNPPANTFVTCTTYHVAQGNVVLALVEDGSVKRINSGLFASLDNQPMNTAAPNPSINTPGQLSVDANGVDTAGFWKSTL